MREKLSVLIPCGNSVNVIQGCLESVTWADEILVVDSFSNDGTLEIAKRYATRILQHEYVDSASQKNWALQQVTHQWVLIVDTDERVSPELRAEIERVLTNPTHCVGFQIPRLNHMWGSPLLHGGNYPDYQLRFFRPAHGRYQNKRVHAHVELDGECGTLKTPLIHFGQRSVDQVVHHLLGDFTTWEAEERLRQGRTFRKVDTVLRPIAAFLYRYFYLRGFRDGVPGLAMAGFLACYLFIAYVKMWELTQVSSR